MHNSHEPSEEFTVEATYDAAKDAEREAFLERYYEAHKACPKCDSEDIKRDGPPINELTAIMLVDSGKYVDLGMARCGCGWLGRVHYLVPGKAQ